MPLMLWTPLFSVGLREIDEQHKVLFNLANEFDDAVRAGREDEFLAPILDQLIEYTEFHFQTEERLMQRQGFSATAAHCLEHERLRRSVEEFRQRFSNGEVDLAQEVLTFFRDWLTHHIMNSDRRLGSELNRKGVH